MYTSIMHFRHKVLCFLNKICFIKLIPGRETHPYVLEQVGNCKQELENYIWKHFENRWHITNTEVWQFPFKWMKKKSFFRFQFFPFCWKASTQKHPKFVNLRQNKFFIQFKLLMDFFSSKDSVKSALIIFLSIYWISIAIFQVWIKVMQYV